MIFGLNKFHQYLYARHFILVTDHKPLIALFGPSNGVPAMAANRLARWALTLSQYDYSVEYRPTKSHGNADALSRLPSGDDKNFDGEEERADVSVVCNVRQLSRQLDPVQPNMIFKESKKDSVISKILRYLKEGWPVISVPEDVKHYKHLEDSLTVSYGCLFFGSRIVIPESVRSKVLDLLHLGHFGMQRMKQLARSVVYWPHIDKDIERVARSCSSCAEQQNLPARRANHPWMMPEKPWSRVHIDHAINFLGSNWLVLIDAYSKYPCIHQTNSVSSKATTDLLEADFAHFGYPHTLVTDNAPAFHSEEFQAWCKERGIVHLSGAPYHPATNGAAERLVQTFKQSIRKSTLPVKVALQEFLLQYRRTPLESGYSPSELLNGRQIRSKLDACVPSPSHVAQGIQSKEAARSQTDTPERRPYGVGTPCYALICGPRQGRQPRWVSAIVVKTCGARSVKVRVFPSGLIWRRHIDQLQPRYVFDESTEPADSYARPDDEKIRSDINSLQVPDDAPEVNQDESHAEGSKMLPSRANPRWPSGNMYSRENPRRSERLKNKS